MPRSSHNIQTFRRRQLFKQLIAATAATLLPSVTGCLSRTESQNAGNFLGSWGRLGLSDGRFQKPRALTIDNQDQVYVVDKTGRIQVFSSDGNFLRGWRTPEIANGKPTGLSIDMNGNVMVADTHYFRVLFYSPYGELLPEKTLGGSFGPEPGQMAFVTDCLEMPDGTFVVSEYGQYDRLQKYSASGEFIASFGTHGNDTFQFSRPQSIAKDANGLLWIADACNHRIVVYDWNASKPKFVKSIGSHGAAPGQFQYPYGLILGPEDSIYVSEYGGHRVQHLMRSGEFINAWGQPGRQPGQFNAPWSIALNSEGVLFVVDSGNNRVQYFRAS